MDKGARGLSRAVFSVMLMVGLSGGCAGDAPVEDDDRSGGTDGGRSSMPDSGAAPDATANDAPSSPAEPRRLIILMHPFGMLDDQFSLSQTRAEAPFTLNLDARDVDLSPILRPFDHLRQYTTVVAGLAMHTNHDANGTLTTMLLTGHRPSPLSERRALGPSVDWMIAQHNTPAAGVPLIVAGRVLAGTFSFDSEGGMVEALEQPFDVHRALFSAQGEPGACEPRTAPRRISPTSQRPLGEWVDNMIPVVLDAFRCDRTRVVTLTLPRPAAGEIGITGDLDQDYADQVGVAGPAGMRAREGITRFHSYVAEQVARLADALRAAPAARSTLLDHTVVAWMSQEGQPGHEALPWHLVLLGGDAMNLQSGRYLQMAQDVPVMTANRVRMAGPPHNRALVTLARLLGLDVDAVGAREIGVPGGAVVQATGGVPGL